MLHNTHSESSIHQVLYKLNTDQSLILLIPNLSKLCNIAALIPVSIAECDNTLSTMNHNYLYGVTKSAEDNYFSSLISMEGPSITEFNFDMAADLYRKVCALKIEHWVSIRIYLNLK